MENKWISVKDELPKDDNQKLLFTNEFGFYRVASYDLDFKEWVDLDDYPLDVTHWMPLPKPPTK